MSRRISWMPLFGQRQDPYNDHLGKVSVMNDPAFAAMYGIAITCSAGGSGHETTFAAEDLMTPYVRDRSRL